MSEIPRFWKKEIQSFITYLLMQCYQKYRFSWYGWNTLVGRFLRKPLKTGSFKEIWCRIWASIINMVEKSKEMLDLWLNYPVLQNLDFGVNSGEVPIVIVLNYFHTIQRVPNIQNTYKNTRCSCSFLNKTPCILFLISI